MRCFPGFRPSSAKPKKWPNRKFFDRPLEIALYEAVRWMFLPFLRGGEMDILPFYEAARWMLRGGEMDGRRGNQLIYQCFAFFGAFGLLFAYRNLCYYRFTENLWICRKIKVL
jgi:hypothetical protein